MNVASPDSDMVLSLFVVIRSLIPEGGLISGGLRVEGETD